MSKKEQAQVDEADVDEFINSYLQNPDPKLTPEKRADLAHKFALSFAKFKNHSPEWAKELARKVRLRMLWVKV